MLKNIIILQNSGMILFSKEFPNTIAQPRLVGSLITTLIEFGRQTTGMFTSFINLSKVSVAIVHNESVKMFCALIYDVQDGKLFGKLLCSEILNAFIQDYSPDGTQFGRNLKDFQGFNKKLQNVIYYSVRPVITSLESKLGIKKSLLVREMEVVDSQKNDINEFGILSNIPALVDVVNEMMLYGNGSMQSICIDGDDMDRVHVWKIQESIYFICVVDTRVPSTEYQPFIEESLEMIEQVSLLHEEYKILLR